MRNLFTKSLFIVFVISLTLGCSLKSDDFFELKPNLNSLTKRANTAIERRGIALEEVKSFLHTQYPYLMEHFKGYDLRIKYENEITVVLVCQNNKAIFEDLSCDLKIDQDYTKENKKCDFYIQYPICE